MKQFADLDEYLSGDAAPGLVLTIAGRRYTVPPPSAETGLWCERLAAAAGSVQAATTDAEMAAAASRVEQLPTLPGDATLPERILGPAHAAMLTDGVDHVRLRIATMTAFLWIVAGDDAAERYWEAGGRPEALAPVGNRGQRRASTTSGGAPTTKQPGSGSGTSLPSTSGRPRRARRSRGRRS